MAVDTTASSYWLNWRVLLCAIWLLGALTISAFLLHKYERCGRKSKKESNENENESEICLYKGEAWLTCSESIHPIWLLTYRLFSFCAMLALIIADTIVHGPRIFFYYTQWTFTLVTIYFVLASALSIYGCLQNCHSERDHGAVTNSGHGSRNVESGEVGIKNRSSVLFWGSALQALFQVCAGAVMLTDIVFWLILFPFFFNHNYKLKFLAAAMHSFNAVFLVGDTILNNLKFPLFRIAYFVLWTWTFVVFQWVFHAFVSTKWPYPFLELSSHSAPIWYLGVGLMHLPSYGIFALIFKIKQFFVSK